MLTNHIEEIIEPLKKKNGVLVLGVSGGIDSMVLLDFFRRLSMEVHVCHVNYQLRGEESEADEQLVREFALKYDLNFHLKKVDLKRELEKYSGNLQALARTYRYNFFNEIYDQENADFILTGHHQDDQIETFLLHLSRSSGLKGLKSMSKIHERIFRPFLDISRKEIEEYANNFDVPYRLDKSNLSNVYSRNRLRNEVLPHWEQYFPLIRPAIAKSIEHLQDAWSIYKVGLNHILDKLLSQDSNQRWSIEEKALLGQEGARSLWVSLCERFSFSVDQALDIYKKMGSHQTGSRILSPTHEVLYDRGVWIFQVKEKTSNESYTVPMHFPIELNTPKFNLNISKVSTWIKIPDNFKVFMDFDHTHFPLKLRIWKAGDTIKPFGMDGRKKKVKKILTDNKLSQFEKESTYVIEDAKEQIIWIPGYCLSESVKVSSRTTQILELEWKNQKGNPV